MKKLAYLLKSSHLFYSVYYYVMSALLKFLGVFIRTDSHLILFNSFGGKNYADSPRTIYEAMVHDKRFMSYKLVWSIQSPDAVPLPSGTKTVKTDTLLYFKTALASRIWITNSSIERGLNFKKRTTFCLNTWHGTPIKFMGKDIRQDNKSFQSKVGVRANTMLAQGQYDVDVFSRAFDLPPTKINMTGLPRNDILAHFSASDTLEIRKKLGIPEDKIVLLYAPTFREFSKGKHREVVLKIPMNLQHWQDALGGKYVILFRAHYEVAAYMSLDGYPLFVDVSSYPNLAELMIASDALISDYSSIYFDYSIMHKPMYCFAYDYDEYAASRGMYIDLKSELPCTVHESETELLEDLLAFEKQEKLNKQRTAEFQRKYVTTYGSAAQACCDILAEELGIAL
ncbi:MAG: CDP-glycerol glycerophosphotransferase family protein [Treponema sp.]|nr:CDP-glycerol glycerophosphotransferase family protein [Treponema sp.]